MRLRGLINPSPLGMGNFFREGYFLEEILPAFTMASMRNPFKIPAFTVALLLLAWSFLASCNKEESRKVASAEWKKGDCIDTVLSPHVMQIVSVEGDQVHMYRMGEMGKEVIKKPVSDLVKGEAPFTKVPCP